MEHPYIWVPFSKSMIKSAADFFQSRPAWIFERSRAGTLFLIQILAALRAQSLAVRAARNLQRQSQQHLLAQHIFQQDSLALIIADLGLRIGNRKLVAACVRAERTVKQFEIAR